MRMRVLIAHVPDRDVLLAELLQIVARHPGNDVLVVTIETPFGTRQLRTARTVDSWDQGLWCELEDLLGGEVERDGDEDL